MAEDILPSILAWPLLRFGEVNYKRSSPTLYTPVRTFSKQLPLQQMGCLYSLYCLEAVEGHPNSLAPGKRPLNTIIPGLATEGGDLWGVFGVMGGSMQPQGRAQLLSNLLDHGMSVQEAVDHPRHRHEGDTLLVEGRFPEFEAERLREMGNRVEVGEGYAVPTGGAQLIRAMENGVRACGSDPRKD